MIKAVGIDIVKIKRLEEATRRWGERFLGRIFTDNELRYCLQKKNPYESLAARFAAKEAYIKATGRRINLRDIEILNEPSGRPYLKLNSTVEATFIRPSDPVIHLSLSHDTDYAIAVVVIEEPS